MSRAFIAPGGAALAPAWVPTFFSNAPSSRAVREIVPVEWWPLVGAIVFGFLAGYGVWRVDAAVQQRRSDGDAGGGQA